MTNFKNINYTSTEKIIIRAKSAKRLQIAALPDGS